MISRNSAAKSANAISGRRIERSRRAIRSATGRLTTTARRWPPGTTSGRRIYEAMIREELADGQHGAFLVWGDPSLYDSTLRIVDQVAAMKTVAFELDVIPGITSVQALAVRHRIALNRIGGPVHITTGRQLAKGMSADDVVVMLDGDCAFRTVKESNVDIYWGAYVGTPDEILISGKLAERSAEIERVRSEARARHGWIMDTYLLRKT